ncbi:MAG: helix-hairpin-helix domain-containing protein [Acidobacteriota bacterium]
MRKYLTGLFFTVLVIFLFVAGNAMSQGIEKVDINLGDSASLQELPGIGPAMAIRIIEYRETNGPFERIEDLMEVKGIGEKRFLNLQDLIVVRAAEEKKGDESREKIE